MRIGRYYLCGLTVVFTLVIIFVAPHPGHTGANENPARDLLAKAVKSMGGLEPAREWQTRVDSGIMSTFWEGWGELHAVCVQSIRKPDKLKLDQDYSAYDHPFFFIYYYNEGEVWCNINMGIRQNPRYTNLMTNKMKRIDGPAYFLAECDTFFLGDPVPDDSLFNGTDINRIGVVDNGDTVFIDVDKKSNLPVRRVQDGGSTHVIISDYRKVGGLLLPFREEVFQNGSKTAYAWDKIEFGVTIDEAIFEEDRPKK